VCANTARAINADDVSRARRFYQYDPKAGVEED